MAADGCWGGRVLFFGGLVTGIFLCYPCTHRQHRLYTRGLTQIHLKGYHEDRRLMCFWGNNLGEIRQGKQCSYSSSMQCICVKYFKLPSSSKLNMV